MVAFILCSPSALYVSTAWVEDHTAWRHSGLRPWRMLVALGIHGCFFKLWSSRDCLNVHHGMGVKTPSFLPKNYQTCKSSHPTPKVCNTVFSLSRQRSVAFLKCESYIKLKETPKPEHGTKQVTHRMLRPTRARPLNGTSQWQSAWRC